MTPVVRSPTPCSLALLLPPVPVGRSVAEVQTLLRALLPLPTFDAPAALAWLAYQQRRTLAADRSHRRRRLRLLLRQCGTPVLSL